MGVMYGAAGRFLVPLDSPAALRYFRSALYAPPRVWERFVPAPRLRRTASMHGTEALTALLEESVWRARPGSRTIFLRDVEGSGRGRAVAFFLTESDLAPYAIAKSQDASGRGAGLRPEAEALDSLQSALPYESSLPRVIDFHSSARGELLITTAVAGRSNYADLRGAILPRRHIERHFDGAARWLGRFHQATGGSHGDFWPGNVLLDDDGRVAVVDWEHFTPKASPAVDLFHYALTYGLNYPWKRYDRLEPEEAFRKTFVERNHVSRAVVRYLRTYSSLTGFARSASAFGEFLATRGAMDGVARERSGMVDFPWEQFRRMFATAKGSPLHELGR
jgi:hypothetical protein